MSADRKEIVAYEKREEEFKTASTPLQGRRQLVHSTIQAAAHSGNEQKAVSVMAVATVTSDIFDDQKSEQTRVDSPQHSSMPDIKAWDM
ncbi:hypothetical protein LTR65_009159 [Meristemomyces frigidus]